MSASAPTQPNTDLYEYIAELAGPELLDRINSGMHASYAVVGGALEGGMRSADVTRRGTGVERVGNYRPGSDPAHRIDMASTLGAGRPMSRKVRDMTSPQTWTVIADLPERLQLTNGLYTLSTLGRYGVAYGLALAGTSNAEATVVVSNVNEAQMLFKGQMADARYGMQKLDRFMEAESEDEPAKASSLKLALDRGLREIKPKTDTVLLASDFMSGFDPETETFDWEDGLSRLHGNLQDRLYVLRLMSPAHRELPLGAFSLFTMNQISKLAVKYEEQADIKEDIIDEVLEGVRHVEVDASGENSHPVVEINDFMHSRPRA